MTGRVLTIHGVAEHVDPTRFSFRNMAETASLHRFLATQPRLVPLREALAGAGSALTIDDAIQGAADAAHMARQLGHAVTLFVNPGQVASGAPYTFLLLNALLDGLDTSPLSFEGIECPTTTMAQRQALRRRIKSRLSSIKREAERLDFVRGLAEAWKVKSLELPPHCATLDVGALRSLLEAGVDLQNHGMWHTDHRSLSGAESADEIREGASWLRETFGIEARFFAAPFGEALPKPEAAATCEAWLTVSDERPRGPGPGNVFNRESLDLWPGASAQTAKRDPLRIVRSWVTRLGRRRPSQ